MPPPAVVPAPVSVGIYYSEELRHHKCAVSKGYIAEFWTFELGPPSIAMFEILFSGLFQDVHTLADDPATTISSVNQDFITVELLEFDGCEASWPILGTTRVGVAYEATANTFDGDVIARWQGRGSAGPSDVRRMASFMDPEGKHLADLTRVAMRRAGADFVAKFEKDLAAQAWLRE